MLDYVSVLIYGILIMFFFLDIRISKNRILMIIVYVTLSTLLQLIMYYTYGSKFIEKIYPLAIHLPIVIFFCFIFKKKLNLVLIFTAPRRWLGEVISLFFNNNKYVLVIGKIMVSIILLILIYKYLCPYVNRILKYSSLRITLLTIIPALSYCITYGTTVYTDLLYQSNMLVVGIFSIGFNFVFYLFIIAYFIEMDKSFELETNRTILQMKMESISNQIDDYKKTQNQTIVYRHDLRHHLRYLSGCISENHLEQALNYIRKLNKDIEATEVKQYCENIDVNLILSAYVNMAQKNDVHIEFDGAVPIDIHIHPTDISVILANCIENAIKACKELEDSNKRKIKVSCKFKNGKLLIEICNGFKNKIYFEGDIPISTEKNHGLGIKSTIAVVKKYNGIYSFTQEAGIFSSRIIL